jgi:hypothetical protein
MPEEELKDNGSEQDDVISDEQLSSAFDSFLNGSEDVTVDEVVDEEVVVEEKPSHSESTQLGRKVAKLFEKTDRLESNVATKEDLYELMKRLDDVKSSRVKNEDVYESVEEEIDLSTKEGIDLYLERRELEKDRRAKESQQKYTDSYLDVMKELLSEVEDNVIASKIREEMVKPGGEYNKIIHGDPSRDCSKNFIGALKKVTKEASKTPFSRDVKDTKTGLSGSSTNSVSNVKPIKLSDDAAELAKRFNMTDDEIREALAGEMPIGLRGKY